MAKTTKPAISFSASGKSITVRAGGVTVRRMIKSITRWASEVHQRSASLSRKYANVSKFPENLGGSGDYTALIREEWWNISDALNGDSINPAELQRSILKIQSLAQSKSLFEEEFYNRVSEYYLNRRIGVSSTKQALNTRAFKVPYADVVIAGNTDYGSDLSRMQAWILDNMPQMSVRKITEIEDYETLADIMQKHDILGVKEAQRIYPELLNKTARRGKKAFGRYYRDRLEEE